MTEPAANPEKNIIVDEDWKQRVETERAAAEGETPAAATAAKPAQTADQPQETPPASLTYLASSLYFQGAIALGLLPNPVTGKAEANLAHARHAIDTLDVLQQKTEGNRTPEESEDLEAMLYQLRMAYVEKNRA